MPNARTPDIMPVLSSGKHRNPRKGACFMELASYLAGERWSDHPKCTHPLVGVLAREVNDHVSDANRARLAPLIPDVVGLTGTDPRVTAWIARDAALMALPIGAAERQGVSAVGILRCEQVLNALEGRPRNYVSPRSAAALAAVPRAHRWALQFSRMGWGEARNFGKRSAPTIVHCAVVSISEACVDDPDDRLVTLLTETIQRCRQWFAIAGEPEYGDRWAAVCELTTQS